MRCNRWWLILFLFGGLWPGLSVAGNYQWQGVGFNYPASWELLTDKEIKGSKIVHLSYVSEDSYPISIFLCLRPKRQFNKTAQVKGAELAANVKAEQFAWPLVQRFSKLDSKSETITSYNQIFVAGQRVPSALTIAPTPQKNILISSQSFYLETAHYEILGTLISRVNRGVIRKSPAYVNRINTAYDILATISLDPKAHAKINTTSKAALK